MLKKDGKIQSVGHVEIKGNVMTEKDAGTGPDGKKFKATGIFIKQ